MLGKAGDQAVALLRLTNKLTSPSRESCKPLPRSSECYVIKMHHSAPIHWFRCPSLYSHFVRARFLLTPPQCFPGVAISLLAELCADPFPHIMPMALNWSDILSLRKCSLSMYCITKITNGLPDSVCLSENDLRVRPVATDAGLRYHHHNLPGALIPQSPRPRPCLT